MEFGNNGKINNSIQMDRPRYLTKSRFKLAIECPTKLFYTGKPEYANRKIEDQFLIALADGGFQVGELAKMYFPGGHDIKSLDYEEALSQTNALLKQDKVIIYEAALRFNNLFIRVDILVKDGKSFDLIEVKAKSYDGEEPFLTKSDTISAKWESYLYDVAFQKHVMIQAFPDNDISAYLMMADKTARCPTDGLNQKFRIYKDERGRKNVSVSQKLTAEDLSPRILTQANVDPICELIINGREGNLNFVDYIEFLADKYEKDEKIDPEISMACANCEFTAPDDKLKSGKHECWKERLGWNDKDFADPTIFDIWNFRKKPKLLEEGRIKLEEVTEEDILPEGDDKPGLSAKERQWMQIDKTQRGDDSIWIDRDNLKFEMDNWKFPMHFIDFETSMVAIPFNKGMHPYEGIAFQFSHHIVSEDGVVEHRGEYLNTKRGMFPNFEFVRKLKAELGNDSGTIFRYSNHENTFLNLIYTQLMASDTSDKDELCEFIRAITKSTDKQDDEWEGPRNMIDMWVIVKRFYYDPETNGSNSIKQVLPAILNSSKYLQKKYSKPIYGAEGGIASKNFKNWQWIKIVDGKVADPYKLLPKMFQDIEVNDLQLLSDNDELAEGGAALTAYARIQFEEMSDYERDEIEQALLKYCELDTMAMVMIYEGWKDLRISTSKKQVNASAKNSSFG
jgi:hypothetical protein